MSVAAKFRSRRVSTVLFCLLYLIRASPNAGSQPVRNDNRSVTLSEPEQAWIRMHPKVHWGADPQWPPFSSFDQQGNFWGIDVEIVKLIASRTGLQVEFVKTAAWSETLRKATDGEIDFVGGIARTDERERLLGLRFTETYCNFPTAIVTRKEMPFLTAMRDLKSRTVALPRAYAATEELQRLYPEIRVVLTDNEEQSMLAVAEYKAEATVLNLASATFVVHLRGLSNLKISGFTDIDFFLCLAARRDSPELCSILQKGLASISPRDKEDIYANYITPETRKALNWRTWRRWFIYGVTSGAAALGLVLLRNQVLKKEIHRRRVVEESLRQARDQLKAHAENLACRAQEMETLNRKLMLANQDLEAFSYSVSHDLKAPVRRVRSFAEMLELSAGKNLNPDSQHCIRGIQEESQRMGDLIEALLAFARVGRTQVHLAPIDLGDLAREVVKELEPEAKGRELRWEVEPLPNAECDRGLMKQVLVNLMSNAAKFTRVRTPGIIKIGALPEKPADDEVVFFVKDNGVGFEKNQAGKLFEAFHRLHRYDEYEGSGVGLANVKRIIQKHGGRVWADGTINLGATFYFSLAKHPAAVTL